MKNIWLMTWYTLREALARKVIIFFMGISVLVIILAAAIFSFMEAQMVIEGLSPAGHELALKEIILALELMFIAPLSGLCLLLAIFASSSFIPVMLEKGNIDLLLSKPVSRTQLILGKYLGGILVVFLNIGFLIIGIWLVISVKFSYWDFGFLSLILVITFTFAVLYALIVWFGVVTKSSTPGMMVAYLIFLILSPLLLFAKDKGKILIESDFVNTIIDGLYYLIPKTSELMGNITVDLTSGNGIKDFQPIISSSLFLILMVYLSITMFNKKDF
ncbi:MAG: ABC transporter permease subunit [Ignavibacteriaceae bacterium]